MSVVAAYRYRPAESSHGRSAPTEPIAFRRLAAAAAHPTPQTTKTGSASAVGAAAGGALGGALALLFVHCDTPAEVLKAKEILAASGAADVSASNEPIAV